MSLFPREMESDRLRYERVHPDELDPLELYEHVREGAPGIETITEYLTWSPYRHPRAVLEWVEQTGTDFEDGTAATYVLRPTDGERAGELAGVASLDPDWDRQLATLGTWLRTEFWGRGYSEERAARFLELAFARLDLDVVAVTHDPENANSQRAIERYVERFGGRREGRLRNHLVVDGAPRDSVRYSVSASEWERNRD